MSINHFSDAEMKLSKELDQLYLWYLSTNVSRQTYPAAGFDHTLCPLLHQEPWLLIPLETYSVPEQCVRLRAETTSSKKEQGISVPQPVYHLIQA